MVRSDVSIPQSGFGAFEPDQRWSALPCTSPGFQSLSRDSGRLNPHAHHHPGWPECYVSIPQSGFGAFERNMPTLTEIISAVFQSLSRDSGRLNFVTGYVFDISQTVSIPQSGFGAFERGAGEIPDAEITCFNPSVGIRGV